MKNGMMSRSCVGLLVCGLAAFLLVLGACRIPFQDRQVPNLNKGTVTVSIPPYAPWFGVLMEETSTLGRFSPRSLALQSRAFLVADRVVLTVFDSEGMEIASTSFDPAAFYFSEEGGAAVEHSLTLDVGTGYTIRADIYNLDESAVNPMVSGISAPFTIAAGVNTPVAITCIPEDPTLLVLDAAETFSQISSVVDMDAGLPLAMGGETWISVEVPGNGILVLNVDLPESSYLGMGIFDEDGLAITAGLNIIMYPSYEKYHWLAGDGYVQLGNLPVGTTIYFVLVLIGDGNSKSFSVTSSTLASITGTITVPGVTDPGILPPMNQIILVPNSLDDSWISNVGFGVPVVVGSDLVYSYTLTYGGLLDGVVYGAMVQDVNNWPMPGDYFGATDGDPETPMDFVIGTGIEQTRFSGTMSNVNFVLTMITSDPVPASAFPDPVLRAAMEDIIGKDFTGVAEGVTNADLLALTTIDLIGRREVYSDLTGLELCDNTYGLFLSENDLSGCDLGIAASGKAYEALTGMEKLSTLMLWDCDLDNVDFITGVANLVGLNIASNSDLSYAELLLIDPVYFPQLGHLWYNGNTSPPVNDTEWNALVEKIAGFNQLYSVGFVGFGLTDEQFLVLYDNALSIDPGAYRQLDFGRCFIGNSSLGYLANLTALESLSFWETHTISNIAPLVNPNLSSLQAISIMATSVTDLTPLEALRDLGAFSTPSNYGFHVNVEHLGLDLWPGTSNRDVIDYLIGEGVVVRYLEGNNLVDPEGTGTLEVTVY